MRGWCGFRRTLRAGARRDRQRRSTYARRRRPPLSSRLPERRARKCVSSMSPRASLADVPSRRKSLVSSAGASAPRSLLVTQLFCNRRLAGVRHRYEPHRRRPRARSRPLERARLTHHVSGALLRFVHELEADPWDGPDIAGFLRIVTERVANLAGEFRCVSVFSVTAVSGQTASNSSCFVKPRCRSRTSSTRTSNAFGVRGSSTGPRSRRQAAEGGRKGRTGNGLLGPSEMSLGLGIIVCRSHTSCGVGRCHEKITRLASACHDFRRGERYVFGGGRYEHPEIRD